MCKGGKRPDLAAKPPYKFEIADGDFDLSLNISILYGWTMGAFIGKQQGDRMHDTGGVKALSIAECFEFMAFGLDSLISRAAIFSKPG